MRASALARRLRGLAGHAELVLARAGGCVAIDVERGGVGAGLDDDLGLGGLRAVLAPRADAIAAGGEAAEPEVLAALDDDVVRRIDDQDVGRHLRVNVAAEPDDARLRQLELPGVAILVEAGESARARDG